MLQRAGRSVNYRAAIIILSCAQLLALAVAAAGLGSVWGLAIACFIGGACGWLSGAIHGTYIILNYENVYTAAFGAGDSLAGVLAAFLSLVQRPALDEHTGRRFGVGIFYLMLAPLVPLSLFAFWYLERTGLGALPGKEYSELELGPDTKEIQLQLHSGDSELGPDTKEIQLQLHSGEDE